MTYQILVATMHRTDAEIYRTMNLSSDAVIINQCDAYRADNLTENSSSVLMLSMPERGVGLSRNTALMRASADIVEFADDDMIFTDTYVNDVIGEFERHPEADAILFSVDSLNPERPLLKINKFSRVSRREALKYGCARLAVRRDKIIYNNIYFSLLFGGGAKYGSGEDTLFLQSCIKAGLKIYKSPVKVADVKQDSSSWFNGYSDKFYFDKGALFAAISPGFCYAHAILSALKARKSFFSRLSLYKRGICEFKHYL